MALESTGSERLLAAAASLGWPALGVSFEGRLIPAAALGGGSGPPLVVVAGVHGDEPSSVEAALELAASLSAGLFSAGPVWLVPVLNPDGLLRGVKNSVRDVDLNRNFPARNFTTEHQTGYFPGEAPLSEPESRALAGLVERVQPWGVVALHAPFGCINYDGPAAAWAAAVSRAAGWPVRADLGYATPGSFGSWLGVDQGIPVLTLELPGGDYGRFRPAAQAALQAAVAWPHRRRDEEKKRRREDKYK
jgi:murein peptide amidase A